jgi:iduronate 2-sulfatase
MGYSVRTASGRYTEWREWSTGRERASELYDHRIDPDETINRAGDATLVADRTALARRLARQFPSRALPTP